MMQKLTEAEEYFLARVEDLFSQVGKGGRARFSAFLDERQQALTQEWMAAQPGGVQNHLFFGGFDEAERQLLGVFPEFQEASEREFPVEAVTFTFRRTDRLTHRDFLGAVMALQVKRECIGDILVGEGVAVVYVLSQFASLLKEELTKVGRVGVRTEIGAPARLPQAHRFEEIAGTVSSLRLDCIVSLLLNLSREKAQRLVQTGLVRLNTCEINSVSHPVKPGDKISVRGAGKFLVEAVGGLTKKGRIRVSCKKYI